MSDCISVGLANHNFRFADERCIDCGVTPSIYMRTLLTKQKSAIVTAVKGLHKEVPNELGYRNCLEVFKSLCENCSDEQQQPVEYPCRGLSEVLALLEKTGE